MSRGPAPGSSTATDATVTFSKISSWVVKSRTLWCNNGERSRSPMPGAPLITTSGDFSAYAPATLFTTLSPPTQYVIHTHPSPLTRA